MRSYNPPHQEGHSPFTPGLFPRQSGRRKARPGVTASVGSAANCQSMGGKIEPMELAIRITVEATNQSPTYLTRTSSLTVKIVKPTKKKIPVVLTY